MKYFIAALSVVLLGGCATVPQPPPEPLISVQLPGTSIEAQQFIEDRIRNKSGAAFHVESATDRAITFKADCADVPGVGIFQCSMIMMAIGNSRWSGPYSVMTFRTNEIRSIVNLTASIEWCATNALGRTNCTRGATNAETNDLLRKIEQAYQAKAPGS